MAVRIEKILCTVLHEAHQQVEETMNILSEGPEGFYKNIWYKRDTAFVLHHSASTSVARNSPYNHTSSVAGRKVRKRATVAARRRTLLR